MYLPVKGCKEEARGGAKAEPEACTPEIGRFSDQLIPEACTPEIGRRGDQT
jgi:hypothetical protein